MSEHQAWGTGGNAQKLNFRARFLLDSFPPRRSADDGDDEEPPTPPEP